MLILTTWDPCQETPSPVKESLVLPAAGYSSMRFGQSLGGDPTVAGQSLEADSPPSHSVCVCSLHLSSLMFKQMDPVPTLLRGSST